MPEEEFWHPQKATRPPDGSVFHTPTTTRYLRRCKVWLEERYDHWVAATPELQFIEDAAFQGPYYIAGKELNNLPKGLLEVSPLATPRMKLTAKVPCGTYRVTESESESEPSDKEPVQQLEDSSNPVSESVLSPLTGLSLIATEKSREPDPGPSEPPKKEVDPFDTKFEGAPEQEEELNEPESEKEPSEPDPGSLILPESPIPDPPMMASALTPTSLLGTCPTFKGK